MDGICVGLISTVILIINTLSFVVSQPDCETTAGFISIDCGATEDHCDNRTKIHWTNDTAYSSIGKRSTIPEGHIFFPDKELLTARSFPEHKKNCYEIHTTDNTKYLLRVRVLYSNFYLTGQDHTMYLIIDDAIIQRIKPTTGKGTFEFIITAVSHVTNVCFGKVNGDPFVNSIELRELSPTMYPLATRDTILSIVHQRAVQSAYDINITRNPVDKYDRFWVPQSFDNVEEMVHAPGNQICADNTVDKVPSDLMSKGVQSNCSIEGYGDIDGYEIALTFFFADIANQGDREIDIMLEYFALNGDLVTSFTGAVPLSGVCNFSIKSDNDFDLINTTYNFTIQSVNYVCPADAHPNPSISPYAILNAWHASSPRYRSQNGTNTTEFATMKRIREYFNIIKWTGDPCLPVNFTWDKVECDYDGPTVTVKSVDLSGMKLHNTVPDLFTNLASLQMLDLSDNDLYGYLPDALFENPYLTVHHNNNPKLRRKVHGLTATDKKIITGIVVPVGIIVLFVGFLACRHFRGKTLEEYTKDTTETQGGESIETSKWRVPWSSPIMQKDPTQT